MVGRHTILTSDDKDVLFILVLFLGRILQGVDELATIGIFVPARELVSSQLLVAWYKAESRKTYIWLTLLYSITEALGFGFSFSTSGEVPFGILSLPSPGTSIFSSLLPTDGGVPSPGTSILSDSLSDERVLPSPRSNILL